ncbi:MAG TPA: YkgJ family cysteine cluster protein [Puia sp.]|nr:YkgJ family cysteine cluster protein [Puia sp.]
MINTTVNIKTFRNLVSRNKKRLRSFLTRVEKKDPKNLHLVTLEANELSWAKTDCMDCANCCKTMSPTYTQRDILRIAKYMGMTARAFKEKWLYKDRVGDWLNKSQPCQFLDIKTNLCGIYEVRPGDCAGFPHHGTKKIKDYLHVYKQNVEFCPATYRLVEFMEEGISDGKWELK